VVGKKRSSSYTDSDTVGKPLHHASLERSLCIKTSLNFVGPGVSQQCRQWGRPQTTSRVLESFTARSGQGSAYESPRRMRSTEYWPQRSTHVVPDFFLNATAVAMVLAQEPLVATQRLQSLPMHLQLRVVSRVSRLYD